MLGCWPEALTAHTGFAAVGYLGTGCWGAKTWVFGARHESGVWCQAQSGDR